MFVGSAALHWPRERPGQPKRYQASADSQLSYKEINYSSRDGHKELYSLFSERWRVFFEPNYMHMSATSRQIKYLRCRLFALYSKPNLSFLYPTLPS
jgi:hypothetical protein